MGQERRRFPRIPEPLGLQYRVQGELGGSWCTVTAVNVSAGGLRFRAAEPLELGVPLTLQMKVPGVAQPMLLRGLVAWRQMQASGVTEYGVEFMDITLPQQRLIDQLVGFLKNRA